MAGKGEKFPGVPGAQVGFNSELGESAHPEVTPDARVASDEGSGVPGEEAPHGPRAPVLVPEQQVGVVRRDGPDETAPAPTVARAGRRGRGEVSQSDIR